MSAKRSAKKRKHPTSRKAQKPDDRHPRSREIWTFGGIVAVVSVAVAVIALWPAFRSTDLTEDANRAAQNADLAVVRVDMTSTVELIEETWSSGDQPKVERTRPVDEAAAKVVLHNSGEQAALIEELRVSVSKVWTPEGCHGAGGGSTSVRYDFIVPGDIRDRSMPLRLSKKIDFEVNGQSNDRLAVTIGQDAVGVSGWPWIISASAELVLTGGDTVRTGEFVLMSYTGVDHVVEVVEDNFRKGFNNNSCIQRNIRTVEEALRAPGQHSPSIQQLLDRLKELGFTANSTPARPPTTSPPDNSYRDTWVAQLGSYPESTTTPDELANALNRLKNQTGVSLQTARSSEYGSLAPGYWVVFHHGAYSNGHEALAFCSAHGINRDDNSCVGRYLSSDTDDNNLICRFSDPPNAPSCVRD